jgi:hypothetical protein
MKKDTNNQKPDKEKKADEKIILWKDEAKIAELQSKLDTLLPLAQSLVKCYHSLEFADPHANFYDVIANSENRSKIHLKKVITEKINIPGIEIDTTAMINNGTYKPSGMTSFLKALEVFNSAGGASYQQYFKHSEKTVIIDPSVWQRFEELHTISAITPDEIELYKKWSHFLIEVREFSAFMLKNHNQRLLINELGPVMIVNLIKLDKQNQWHVNHSLFQSMTKKTRSQE